MRFIPWYFASKYDSLEECEDVKEEIGFYARRVLVPMLLSAVVLCSCVLAGEYIDIPGWDDITTLIGVFTGVVFGIAVSISEMLSAVNLRKEEIVEEMWDSGYPAKGQRKED